LNTYFFPFEKLDVWQLAVELAEKLFYLLDQLPQNKFFAGKESFQFFALSLKP
jgi:hypothetical protein